MGGGLLAGAALAWLGGIAAQLSQPALWPTPAYAAVASAAAFVLLVVVLRKARTRAPEPGAGAHGRRPTKAFAAAVAALAAVAIAALGFSITGWRAAERLAERLPEVLEGRDLQLVGVVASLPRVGADGMRFVFEVEQAFDGGPGRDGATVAGVPRRVSLGWFADAALPVDAPRAGERWRLPVRLKRAHGSVNGHGFDFELWLFEQGIGGVGHVRSVAGAARLDASAGHVVQRLRQHVRDAVARQVDGHAAGVIAALAVGDQAAIDRDDWALFRHTGVTHLMAISGLHVTMFAWLAAGVIGFGWRRSARLATWWPTPVAARWGGLAVAAAYAALAGWGVPAQRTLWMLAAAVALPTLGIVWPWPLVLLAAAVVVTAVDPWALLQPGFWLSFVAVGLLIAAAPAAAAASGWRSRTIAALRGGVHTQVVATLGLAPLTLLFFQQVSLVGFLANLLAIPVVTLAVTPLALAGIVWPACWSAAAALLQALGAALSVLAAIPGALWWAAAAPGWAVAAGLAGGALLVLPLPWRLRALGVPLLLPLLAPAPTRPPAGAFEVVVPEVGQGSAVLVRTRAHLLLYDAGPQYGRDSDAGERVLLPLLRARGEGHIDTLMLSHRDSDHVGGGASVLEALPVARLAGSLEPGHALVHGLMRTPGAPPFEPCRAGQRWAWDGVDFEVLHPPRPGGADNAASCVLRVRDAAGRALLLAGDIGVREEAALVAAHGTALRSDALLVPHHGSRGSSSDAFVDAVAPRMALVQAGYRNRYGHPAPEVAQRYAGRGIALVESVDCGGWRWDGSTMSCARRTHARYWHHRRDAARSQAWP